MSVVWAGSYKRSPQPLLGSAARWTDVFRRRPVPRRRSGGQPRAVVFSEWVGVLDALGQLHKFAAGGSTREGEPTLDTPAASTFGWDAVPLPDAGADRVPADVRSDPWPASPQARVAAHKAARSLP